MKELTHFKSKVRFFRENECKVGPGPGDEDETSLSSTWGKVEGTAQKCKVGPGVSNDGKTSLSLTWGKVGELHAPEAQSATF
ncbi:hypothetical protein B0H12DRAFT_1152333 [Mycena haematopus]|nr:hypothetical protein B0H12DRAFT_1152333 [Mycena haematopus]